MDGSGLLTTSRTLRGNPGNPELYANSGSNQPISPNIFEQHIWPLNRFKMFDVGRPLGDQSLNNWPSTYSNDPITPNNSEHVRTFAVLFVCPATEQNLPLSIRQGRLFVGPLGGRRKESLRA